MKNTNKGKFHIFSAVFSIISLCLLSVSVIAILALTQINMQSVGGAIEYRLHDKEDYKPPTTEEIKNTEDALNGAGFICKPDNSGNVVIANGIKSNLNDPVKIKEMHNLLMGKDANDQPIEGAIPMLRYVSYTHSLCDEMGAVIAVLDLSRTRIEIFGPEFLKGMRNVLFGVDKNAFKEDLYVVDTETGSITTQQITLPAYVSGSNRPYYAIRIILPNYACSQNREIIFQDKSLMVHSNDNIEFVDLDITRVNLTPEIGHIKGLDISAGAMSATDAHLHLFVDIGNPEQQKLALQYAMDEIMSSNGSVNIDIEMFLKNYDMPQISMYISGTSNATVGKEFSMYGLPNSDPYYIDSKKMLESCAFLHNINTNYLTGAKLNYCTRALNNTISLCFPVTVYPTTATVNGVLHTAGELWCNGVLVGNYLEYTRNG